MVAQTDNEIRHAQEEERLDLLAELRGSSWSRGSRLRLTPGTAVWLEPQARIVVTCDWFSEWDCMMTLLLPDETLNGLYWLTTRPALSQEERVACAELAASPHKTPRRPATPIGLPRISEW